jgi:hypothetical protein
MKVIAVAPEASKYSVARFWFGAFASMAATDSAIRG